MAFALPSSDQSRAFKKTHKAGGAYPMNSRQQAASARGFAVMNLNKGNLTIGEARTIFRRTESVGLLPRNIQKRAGKFSSEPTTRSKTKMAKRRTSRKSSTRRVVKRSTRAGGRRKTSRRAYRRSRPNPGRIIGTPAFRYGLSAVGGAVVASYVDANSGEGQQLAMLRPGFLPAWAPASAVAAGLAFAAAAFLVKRPRTRQTLVAVGTGMLLPTVLGTVAGAMTNGNDNDRGQLETQITPLTRQIRAPRGSYVSSSAFVADLIPG